MQKIMKKVVDRISKWWNGEEDKEEKVGVCVGEIPSIAAGDSVKIGISIDQLLRAKQGKGN